MNTAQREWSPLARHPKKQKKIAGVVSHPGFSYPVKVTTMNVDTFIDTRSAQKNNKGYHITPTLFLRVQGYCTRMGQRVRNPTTTRIKPNTNTRLQAQ